MGIRTNLTFMKNASVYNDIISAIEKLYSSITLRIWQKRMNTYHAAPSIDNINGQPIDFKSPLFKYIDELSSQQQANTAIQSPNESHYPYDNHPNITSDNMLPYQPVINKENVNDLSKYFKTKHNDAELHPGIEEKLKHSIWEHIHASILLARRGNAVAAKMHADIANSAFKELAHYVSNDVISELALEIENQLDVLLNNK